MERSPRYMEVRGKRNYWPMSAPIIRRFSKPRIVHWKPGYGKEKTEAASETQNRENQRVSGKSLQRTQTLEQKQKITWGRRSVFIT